MVFSLFRFFGCTGNLPKSVIVFEREIVYEEYTTVTPGEIVAIFTSRCYYYDIGGNPVGISIFEFKSERCVFGYGFSTQYFGIRYDMRVVFVE